MRTTTCLRICSNSPIRTYSGLDHRHGAGITQLASCWHGFWVKLPYDHGSPRRALDREESASHHERVVRGHPQTCARMYACTHVCRVVCTHGRMCSHLHVYMHARTYACTHTIANRCMHKRRDVCTYMHTCMQICIHACAHAHMHANTYKRKMYVNARSYACTHARMHAYTHARMHTCTHAHLHT